MTLDIFPLLILVCFLTSTMAFDNYIKNDCQFNQMWNTYDDVQHPIQILCRRWTFPLSFQIYRRNALHDLNQYWLTHEKVTTAGLINSETP